MIRKLVFGAVVLGLVMVGFVAQTSVYVLALPSPAGAVDGTVREAPPLAGNGPHPIGVRRLAAEPAPIEMTVWYPAVDQTIADPAFVYSYSIRLFSPDSAVAIATYEGLAVPGARPDLSDGPYPLVILSHGFAIGSGSYAWLAEHLASYGFVVISPHHRETLDPGALWRATIERPRDIQTVLSYVDGEVGAGGEFEDLIDNETVAAVGHSYGGYTALAASGARISTREFVAACETARDRGSAGVSVRCARSSARRHCRPGRHRLCAVGSLAGTWVWRHRRCGVDGR